MFLPWPIVSAPVSIQIETFLPSVSKTRTKRGESIEEEIQTEAPSIEPQRRSGSFSRTEERKD